MADTPVPYGPHPVPLETAVVSCWRFGGPSRRHVLRFDPCETCTAMPRRCRRDIRGGRSPERTHGKGDVCPHEKL